MCVWEIHGIILSFMSLYNSYEYNNSTYVMMTSSSKGDMKLLLSLSHYYYYYYYFQDVFYWTRTVEDGNIYYSKTRKFIDERPLTELCSTVS